MCIRDSLYVARRITRFASEDVGLADPRALEMAVAAYQACHYTVSYTHLDVYKRQVVTLLRGCIVYGVMPLGAAALRTLAALLGGAAAGVLSALRKK